MKNEEIKTWSGVWWIYSKEANQEKNRAYGTLSISDEGEMILHPNLYFNRVTAKYSNLKEFFFVPQVQMSYKNEFVLFQVGSRMRAEDR